MLAALTAAAKFLAAPVGKWLGNRRAISEKKLDVKLAALENDARLLRDTQQANTTWETERIRQTDKWANRFVVVSLFWPFYAWWFAPEKAVAFGQFLQSFPAWYTGITASVVMALFGLRKALQWRQYRRETTPAPEKTG